MLYELLTKVSSKHIFGYKTQQNLQINVQPAAQERYWLSKKPLLILSVNRSADS